LNNGLLLKMDFQRFFYHKGTSFYQRRENVFSDARCFSNVSTMYYCKTLHALQHIEHSTNLGQITSGRIAIFSIRKVQKCQYLRNNYVHTKNVISVEDTHKNVTTGPLSGNLSISSHSLFDNSCSQHF